MGELHKKKSVRLFEDQFVSPSLADSVASMLAELGEKRLPGIWNTCGADVVDRVTFGRALCEVFGFDPSLITPTALADLQLASPRPRRCGLKVAQTAAALKAQPLELSDALKQFHGEYRGSNP